MGLTVLELWVLLFGTHFPIQQVLRSSGSRRDKNLLSVSLENNTISPFQQLCHILVRQILGFDKSQNC